ncbi:hypothetical protein HPB51_008131 [Rhipicephalus microplus]|uniref:G-protein coupled receptors family 1 profile domain-containing protein n=1 Tax=Rhipicephalus microplus TaxID=6941 RepID=A0A9J6EFK9_RHIMP|nr:hypothetical protein HPB51_008131 [Rhipicephalus microplus]
MGPLQTLTCHTAAPTTTLRYRTIPHERPGLRAAGVSDRVVQLDRAAGAGRQRDGDCGAPAGPSIVARTQTFLVNLALSDIAMAVFSIPFTYTDFMLGRWIFEPLFCPVVLFMQHVSVIVSVYTLTAIGVDRLKPLVSVVSGIVAVELTSFIRNIIK